MRLTLYTQADLYELAKAIMRNVSGVDYPFSPRTFQRALAQVASLLGASASAQTLNLVNSMALESTTGTLLDRRGLENNTPRFGSAPARCQGRVIPIVSPAAAAYTAPAGTIVIQPATATQSEIAFKLEAAATIPLGGSQSNLVSAVALEYGTAGNDIASGTSLSLKYSISGISHFLLSSDSGGGVERQSEDEYRTAIRNARRSFGESTWAGIESLLKTVRLSSGNRITVSRVFEDFVNGTVTAYIDDGSGSGALVGPQDSTTYGFGGGNYWYYNASGSDVYVRLPYSHLPSWSDGVDASLDVDTGAGFGGLTEGVDYWVDIDTGIISLAAPLSVGDQLRAQFTFYTGLVGEAARLVNGVYGSSTVRGWRPVGQSVRVRGPLSVDTPTVEATLFFEDDKDSHFGRELAASLVLTYLDSLNIGEAARYSKINKILLSVPGADRLEDYTLDAGTADVGPTSPYGVIRGDASLILV